MGNNVERLGNVLAGRMKKTAGAAVPTSLELGTINPNMTLTTDSLQATIPKGDYLVNLLLLGSSYGEMSEDVRTLTGGDRVLVAWCGNDPVVIAVVTSS